MKNYLKAAKNFYVKLISFIKCILYMILTSNYSRKNNYKRLNECK